MRRSFTPARRSAWTVVITTVVAICFGCGTQVVDDKPISDTPLAVDLAMAHAESAGLSSKLPKNYATPLSRFEVDPTNSDLVYSRLESVVPPCVPYPSSDIDPCERRSSWEDNNPYVEDYFEFPDIFPTFQQILLDRVDWPFWATHFVVRATVIPGSTRCAWTDVQRDHSVEYLDYEKRLSGDGKSYCYYDLAVNEYLHGDGPARLTVNFGTKAWGGYSPCDSQCLVEGARHIEDITGYEGVEWIIYLGGPSDLGTSVWLTFGFDDVQRREDGEVVVVSEWKQRAPRDTADINWSRLEYTLADFRVVVSDAYKAFKTLTGGRTGNVADRFGRMPPFFAEDAGPDGFNDYITSTKMLDGLDITPSPPPPIPGEGDPDPSGLTINDVIATRVAGGLKVPGGLTDFNTPTPILEDEPTATTIVEPTATTATEITDTPTAEPEETATVEPTATTEPMPTVTPEPVPTPEPIIEPVPTPDPADTPTPESDLPLGPGDAVNATATPEDPHAPSTSGEDSTETPEPDQPRGPGAQDGP